MVINILIGGITADGRVYPGGRVEDPGPQLLEFAREKREISGRLIAEFIEEENVIEVRSEEDCFEYDGTMYRCLLCDFVSANRGAIGGHVRWKHLGRR